MSEVTFSYTDARVPAHIIPPLMRTLVPVAETLKKLPVGTYTVPESCLNLCLDTHMHAHIHALARVLKREKPALIIVIGIGGSSLGTMAIDQCVNGSAHDPALLYVDTVDTDNVYAARERMKQTLKEKRTVIVNIISKSGTTIETSANGEIFLNVLKNQDKRYAHHTIITTDKGTPLEKRAQDEGFHLLEIPRVVGGRYSVLSPVGLFPLALAGYDIDQLLAGARTMRARCLTRESPAGMSATLRSWHARHGKTIHDLFLFGNGLHALGAWYRQLFAESLGKGCDAEGKVCVGITPTFSMGTTDMHSIAQLYLGGPFDKYTTFVTVRKNRHDVKTPSSKNNESASYLQAKPLSHIMKALYEGVRYSFAHKKRPFSEIILPDKSEHIIGQLMQFQMMEVIYLGHLLHINPFDQPDIEDYKNEARRLLA